MFRHYDTGVASRSKIGLCLIQISSAPMRAELTSLGIEELRTAADVDAAVTGTEGTLMVVVNSVCGCAAGRGPARSWPLRCATASAPTGWPASSPDSDVDATDRARNYFVGCAPRRLSVALLRNGKLVSHARTP